MPARLISREVLPFFLSLAALVLAALLSTRCCIWRTRCGSGATSASPARC